MTALDRLTLGQRKALFALGVVVLAMFVVTSFATARPYRDDGDRPAASVASERRVEAPQPPGLTEGARSDAPAALDPATLGEAKRVATAFVERYASYRYDEEPEAKAEGLRPFVTKALGRELASDSGATAARRRMVEDRETVTATVEAVQTQAVRSGAVELLVIVRQDVERAGQRAQRRPTYQVALVPSPRGWAVASVSR